MSLPWRLLALVNRCRQLRHLDRRRAKVTLFAFSLDKHFVQKVGIAEAGESAAKTFGKVRAEFVDPETNGLVADVDISFG